jgi:hypothetical protein
MISVCLQDLRGIIARQTCEAVLPQILYYILYMPGQSEMETQEVNPEYQTLLAPLSSEPAQAPADDSLLYHMSLTRLSATRSSHSSKADILDDSRTYLSLASCNTDARDHLTGQLGNLCFVEVFWASNQILQYRGNVTWLNRASF